MRRSLKWQLAGWIAGGMVLIVGIYAGLVHEAIEHALKNNFNAALLGTARAIAATVHLNASGNEIEVDFTEQEMPEFRRDDNPDYFEAWADDGSVLCRSTSLGKNNLSPLEATIDNPVVSHSVKLPDGRPGRAMVIVFRAPKEKELEIGPKTKTPPAAGDEPTRIVTLVVARGTAGLTTQLSSLQWLVGVAGGATIVLVLAVTAIVVRLGMRSFNTMAGRIAAIREDDLSDRVPTDALPVEMVPVAARLNELLGRLDAAFRRERALTADVAHELRTPLAGMRSTIEVALSRPRSAEEQKEALAECLDIVRQTQAMTDNLLALARIEGGQVSPQPRTVPLAETVDALWQPSAASTRARRITFRNSLPADLACTLDHALLSMALQNILANAAEYTNDGGRIEVSAGTSNGTVELIFSNSGCTLTTEQMTHVFDQFWRGDASRTGTGSHCGLGLALVERAVKALGGSVSAETAEARFILRLRMPAS
jgi:two-component system, OmpR family, heavy metal sensor histidine kinase CusS